MFFPKLSASLSFALFLLIVASITTANAQVIDTSFDARLDTTTFIGKQVSKMLIQPDGKMIASGSFNRYNGRIVGAMVRVNPDGSLDNSFNTELFQSGINSNDPMKLLADGKILICGSFTFADGTTLINRVIRLNANGTLDSSFSFEPTGWASYTGVDDLGRVYALGNLQYVRNGQTLSRGLVRLNPDGSVDDSFNTLVPMDRFTLQGNKVVHYISEIPGIYWMGRLNEDGSPDNTFTRTNLGGFTPAAFKAQTDHKIVLLRDTMVIRINVDGGIDNTFQSPTFPVSGTPQMIVGADDRMTIVHSVTTAPYGVRFIRLLPNGAADPSFTPYTNPTFAGWGVRPDGSVMIGDSGLDFAANTFVKLFPGGQVDSTYNAGGIGFQNIAPGKIRAIRVLPSNKILIGGDFDKVNTTSRSKIALLNSNSTLDLTFQISTTPTGNYFSQVNDIYEIELQSDGKLLVSGAFTYFVNGVQKTNVVRLNPNGSIDATFSLGLNINDHFVTSGLSTNKPAARADGKILIGNTRAGSSSSEPQPPIQLSANGARDTAFAPTLYAGNGVVAFDLAVLPSGKILLAGRYSYLEGGSNTVTKGFVARLNSDGTTDASFQRYEVLDKNFVALRVLPDGKILVIQRSNTSSRLYRLNSDGTPDGTFNDGVGANGRVNSMAVVDGGRILVGGLFTSFNGSPRTNLALLGPDGQVMPRVVDTNKEVLCLTLDNDGRVLVGGFFTSLSQHGPSLVEGEQQFNVSYLARINVSISGGARAPFDFDGDGKTDLGIYRPSVGEWWINHSGTGNTPAFQFGSSTDLIAPADYTGDGKTDVALFRPSTGEWYILRSEDNSYYSAPFGTDGDVPVPADFDGDGRADVAVFRPSSGTWFISRSSGGTTIEQFGATGDQPVAADYDGDGKADLAIYRPSVGQWWLNRSTAGVVAYGFGGVDAKAVQGDYTGDGKTDVAYWRPSTGEWCILRSEDTTYYSGPFGTGSDIPAPGDYDGDGKFDPTVFRPSSGTWYSQRTTAGTLIRQFGATGDRPIPNAFVR